MRYLILVLISIGNPPFGLIHQNHEVGNIQVPAEIIINLFLEFLKKTHDILFSHHFNKCLITCKHIGSVHLLIALSKGI